MKLKIEELKLLNGGKESRIKENYKGGWYLILEK